MDILLVGATARICGGVEQFCLRATAALLATGRHRVTHLHANTAYLRPRTLNIFLKSVANIVLEGRRRPYRVWLQYSCFPDLIILLICKLVGLRVLVTPHLGSNWVSQRNPVLNWLALRLLKCADGIALLSNSQKEELIFPKSVPLHNILTYLPSTLPIGARLQSEGRLRLIHIARLSEAKGTFTFLDICARLKGIGYDFDATLIGQCDAQTMNDIQACLSSNDIGDRVRYLGVLDEAGIMRELLASDILLHLSKTDSFPLIVLEAIGCGVFPICRNLPGARTILQTYCGHIVRQLDPAESVLDFLAEHRLGELRATAEAAGRRCAEDYQWHRCVDVLETAMGKALGRDDVHFEYRSETYP